MSSPARAIEAVDEAAHHLERNVSPRLALEELPEGGTLDVILDDGEPMRNVPRSVKGEGHRILRVREQEDGTYRLTIRNGSI